MIQLKNWLALCMAMAGLSVLTNGARAQNIEFDTTNINNPTDPLTYGSWHVDLHTTDWKVWSIRIDPNTGLNTPGLDNGSGGITPIPAHQVALKFVTTGAGAHVVTASLPGTTGGTFDGTTLDTWSNITNDSSGIHWQASAGQALGPTGANYWLGTITLNEAITTGKVGIALTDGGVATPSSQWSGSASFTTPEASSIALLLPGLLPIGYALRHRRLALRKSA